MKATVDMARGRAGFWSTVYLTLGATGMAALITLLMVGSW